MKKLATVMMLGLVGFLAIMFTLASIEGKNIEKAEDTVRSTTIGYGLKTGYVLDSYFDNPSWIVRGTENPYEVQFTGQAIIRNERCTTLITYEVNTKTGSCEIIDMGFIGDSFWLEGMSDAEVAQSLNDISAAVSKGCRGY